MKCNPRTRSTTNSQFHFHLIYIVWILFPVRTVLISVKSEYLRSVLLFSNNLMYYLCPMSVVACVPCLHTIHRLHSTFPSRYRLYIMLPMTEHSTHSLYVHTCTIVVYLCIILYNLLLFLKKVKWTWPFLLLDNAMKLVSRYLINAFRHILSTINYFYFNIKTNFIILQNIFIPEKYELGHMNNVTRSLCFNYNWIKGFMSSIFTFFSPDFL